MKKCIDCGEDFECKGRNTRCSSCQDRYRKRYQKKYQPEYKEKTGHNKKYWTDKPSSVSSGRYYQFYKFANELELDEIQIMVTKKRSQIKYQPWNKLELRTQIKILTQIYSKKLADKKMEQFKEMEKDDERREIIERGYYESYEEDE